MKQHITSEQLNELTLEQKEKLENWVFQNIIKTIKKFIPLLTIGQMIEFLDDNKIDWSIIDGWFGIGHWVDWDGADFWEKKYDNKELCDALWDSCKEVLNKD